MLDRRWVLLGSLATLSGCAEQSLEDCNPNTGGPADYFACRDQYRRRYDQDVVRHEADEAQLRDEYQTRQRLEEEDARTSEELREVRSQIAELRAERAALEARLSRWAGDMAQARADVADARRYLLALDAANARVVAYQPPPLPPGYASERLQQRLADVKQAAEEKRSGIQRTIELVETWMKLGVSFAASEFFKKEVLPRILRDMALEELGPYAEFLLILHDISELREAWIRSREILSR